VRNLTWWTLTEEEEGEIPLQKVSSISRREKNQVQGSAPVRRTVCGRGTGLCSSAEEVPLPRIPSVRESVFWSRFCCVNAILLICVNIFLYAYFA
ncbi:unnamed protein product, partial [Coregonus sp. 'balchen']